MTAGSENVKRPSREHTTLKPYIAATQPFDLVNFFFNFQRLEVVKLCLVGLELGVELVLARIGLRQNRQRQSLLIANQGQDVACYLVLATFK